MMRRNILLTNYLIDQDIPPSTIILELDRTLQKLLNYSLKWMFAEVVYLKEISLSVSNWFEWELLQIQVKCLEEWNERRIGFWWNIKVSRHTFCLLPSYNFCISRNQNYLIKNYNYGDKRLFTYYVRRWRRRILYIYGYFYYFFGTKTHGDSFKGGVLFYLYFYLFFWRKLMVTP